MRRYTRAWPSWNGSCAISGIVKWRWAHPRACYNRSSIRFPVRVVDTQVADALIRTAQAAQLLGASVILTGITREVVQTCELA